MIFSIVGDRNRDIFPLGTTFCTVLTYNEQRLNCVLSVHAKRTAHDYFIIVTHMLHLSAKKTYYHVL